MPWTVTNPEPVLPRTLPRSCRPARWGLGLDLGLGSSEEETEAQWVPCSLRLRAPGPPPERFLLCPHAGPHPRVTALSALSVSGRSVDPGLAGLLGQQAPRSKQPFVVTFFRASPGPVRAPRAVRPLKRRLPKRTNELPPPNKLPGIFGEVGTRWWGQNPPGFSGVRLIVRHPATFPDTTLPLTLGTSHGTVSRALSICPRHPEVPSCPPWLTRPPPHPPIKIRCPWWPSVLPRAPCRIQAFV